MSSPEPAPKKEKKEKKSKEEKAAKKARKEAKRAAAALEASSSASTSVSAPPPVPAAPPAPPGARPLHVAAQVAHAPSLPSPSNSVSLMLFYQYIEPLLSPDAYQALLRRAQALGEEHGCTGRMRCAREGLNCTLTGSHGGLRAWAAGMRAYHPAFLGTEFKLTDGLPEGQRFPKLNVIPCEEIVNYGLGGAKAPPIDRTAVHLEPAEYHEKMKESDTVIIDVRNHYEAIIGRFDPPPGGAKMLDPKMRKSTEFPVWLNKQSTKDELKGKQVLMYCTGGVRCERAGALLKQQLATEADNLGVKGVYQLQGGIHKYLDEHPDGGHWKGKNYVFDKRFAHGCVEKEATSSVETMSTCEACKKPWDKFRGKRRCPTCGVPSLICKPCLDEDKERKHLKDVQCDLCVEEGVKAFAEVRGREKRELEEYERNHKLMPYEKERLAAGEGGGEEAEEQPKKKQKKFEATGTDRSDSFPLTAKTRPGPNKGKVTRLWIGNLDTSQVDAAVLSKAFPNIKFVQWVGDGKGGFKPFCWVEMKTPEDAALVFAAGRAARKLFGKAVKVNFDPDTKSAWPPPNAEFIDGGGKKD
ncbi:hypothetical protein TeGR_g12088 [Tetraparma gracilis]|uniref:Rhodanese domain-containing protein n=1 Tax=Tetraparma gracilis TaxID=2962635 RepID=A0ABQ6MM04_9STRA|nr:hypothetical protein TeGR_g12088 [Tetraparma gracilis]